MFRYKPISAFTVQHKSKHITEHNSFTHHSCSLSLCVSLSVSLSVSCQRTILPHGSTFLMVQLFSEMTNPSIGWLVVLEFNATLTAKVISWQSVMHMYFLAFSHQYEHNFLSKATNYFSHMLQQR